jgi:fermentation-respiration switch protein FrsA (DUF1100 family)
VAVEARFAVDRGEPLGLDRSAGTPPRDAPELRCVAFEFTSRGDRVPGHVWLPTAGNGPFPVVLLQHGATGSRESSYMASVGAPWVRGGAAVACIDFPLHGRRHNAKLSETLFAGLAIGGVKNPATPDIASEFVRQSVIDLSRTVDALERFPELDARRLAYAGLSLGGIVGATYCAIDPRPRGAALALAGGGFGGPDVDPAARVARIAPRPVLFVNMKGDRVVPPVAAEALVAAAREPKSSHWFEGDHREIPGAALKLMWGFLGDQIGLSTR